MARKSRQVTARENRHARKTMTLPQWEQEDLLHAAQTAQSDPLVLLLDEIEDPHNLGACLRTANAAGALAVVTPKHHATKVTDTVMRVSAGAAEHTPVVQVPNLARCIEVLQRAGLWIVGTSDQATQSFSQLDLKGPLALVMGSEGKGMRRLTAEKCDFLGKLPMRGQVECLNVSVATGICLFEIVRQRM